MKRLGRIADWSVYVLNTLAATIILTLASIHLFPSVWFQTLGIH